ncbi:Atp11p [Sporobolomyces salmoneus]|uniref:Atp11p n=1 Tax=Sporobolomyces salmoneus TaxID=183962 RepID=UPI00317EA878
MLLRTLRLLPTTTRPLQRSFSRFTPLSNASPEWESLIGGKAGIERKRQLFEQKYKDLLEAKAKQQGITVEELKEKVKESEKLKQATERMKKNPVATAPKGPAEAGSMGTRPESQTEQEGSNVVKPLPSSSKSNSQAVPAKKKGDSPVKPLHDIMDLSKVSELTSSALAQLWTTYHQAKGFLSAAIPTETYLKMVSNARKYPLFVVPLQRDVIGETPDGTQTDQAVEMHILNWALLPPPETATEPVPSPSSVLFTPLAEYKSRQEYAQPYLILTHYTDLSNSHDLVLMRGEITPNVSLDDTEAQILAIRMQLFYHDKGTGGEVERERNEMLRVFHQEPEKFEWERLIKLGEITETK